MTKLQTADVHVIFNEYYEYNTKFATTEARTNLASQVHKLELNTDQHKKVVLLTMEIIIREFKRDMPFHQKNTQKHKFVIAGHENRQ